MRVGILGGSFNPAHEGHRHIADTAKAQLGLHKVIWLVSPQNPLKALKAPSLAARMEKARRVATRGTAVSGLESDLGSPYTIDTLVWLKRRYPGVRFFWLMGTDNLLGLHRWRRWREIPRSVEVAVAPRPGSTLRGRTARGGEHLRRFRNVRWLDAPLNAASSTALRESAN